MQVAWFDLHLSRHTAGPMRSAVAQRALHRSSRCVQVVATGAAPTRWATAGNVAVTTLEAQKTNRSDFISSPLARNCTSAVCHSRSVAHSLNQGALVRPRRSVPARSGPGAGPERVRVRVGGLSSSATLDAAVSGGSFGRERLGSQYPRWGSTMLCLFSPRRQRSTLSQNISIDRLSQPS
jgi:hypothetical protein